ncbi:hypothetical protein [Kitasatospora sp. NPDC057015]|uniref:hypothetical protein n=1 Tax=Kitasatospora sp. NPDC057015 TaxID=3346001 RepID=UPI00363ADAC1
MTWSTGTAQAWDGIAVTLTGPHSVGMYITPYVNNKEPYVADLHPGDTVYVNCWTTGDNINNQGNVWYHVIHEYYNASGNQFYYDYVYGAYVDSNNTWRARASNGLAHC